MKIILAVMLVVAPAFAQNAALIVQKACGVEKASFDVTLDPTKHSLTQPDAGKAIVYFIQDEPANGIVSKVGMDGAWVGATKSGSWFSVSVPPGEHHFCVSHQTHLLSRATELRHFMATAGKAYYFRIRYLGGYAGTSYASIFLDRLDSDQALYLIYSYPRASWCPSATCATR